MSIDSATDIPFTTVCPACGADILENDAEVEEADTEGGVAYPPCAHCALDVDVFFPPYSEGDEPLNVWLSSRLGRSLLVDLNHAVTEHVLAVAGGQAATAMLPPPLGGLVADVLENRAENEAGADEDGPEDAGEDGRDFGADVGAFDSYLLALLPTLPGFHSVTQYEDNNPMSTALHHVFWASDPDIFLDHARRLLRQHTARLRASADQGPGDDGP